MAENKIDYKKIVDKLELPLNRVQREYVVQQIKAALTSSPFYTSMMGTQQSLALEAVRFKFMFSQFPYEKETETWLDDNERPHKKETYVFKFFFQIPGFVEKEMGVEVSVRIAKEFLDGRKV